MGNFEDAILKFKFTLEFDSEADFIHETYINIGKCYFQIGDFDNALTNLLIGKSIAEKRSIDKWVREAEKLISEINGDS